MENMGPMARALERLRIKKLLNSGAMKGKYYSKWHARLKYVKQNYLIMHTYYIQIEILEF